MTATRSLDPFQWSTGFAHELWSVIVEHRSKNIPSFLVLNGPKLNVKTSSSFCATFKSFQHFNYKHIFDNDATLALPC